MTHYRYITIFDIHTAYSLPPPEGGSEKLRKGGGSMVQGLVLLKKGWGGLTLFLFNFFIFKFINYFTPCKTALCTRRKFFSCHHNFMKKGHSKLSKNEPENIP